MRPTRNRTTLQRTGFALALWAAVPVFTLLMSRPAAADFRLCNNTASRVGIAVGYKDRDGWTTEGWWNVAPQTCETLYKGALSSRFYYIQAIDYDRGGEWAGKSVMCTTDKSFTIRGVQDCARRGYKSNGFFEVDTLEAKDWTIRLTDPSERGR